MGILKLATVCERDLGHQNCQITIMAKFGKTLSRTPPDGFVRGPPSSEGGEKSFSRWRRRERS